MITKVGARNYKNLDLGEEGLTLGPLAVFVGANGSGKSNLIQLLRFFQEAMTGAPEARRGVTAFEAAVQKLGGGRILNSALPYPSRIIFDLDFSINLTQVRTNLGLRTTNEGKPHTFASQIGLQANDQNTVIVGYENLTSTTVTDFPLDIYQIHVGGGTFFVFDGDGTKTVPLPIENYPNNQLAFQGLQDHFRDSDRDLIRSPYSVFRSTIHWVIAAWSIYSASAMNLEAVRNAAPELGLGDSVLSESGENLALVLYNLARDIAFEERLTEAMRELFPRTRKMRVTTVGRRSLTLEWFVHGSERPFFLDELSDGTVRMLCWAAVLLSPKPSTLIVLDEPEAGVHPAWLRILAGWIREASRKTQVIVSTHSSDLLDHFTDDLESVHVFQPSAKDPGLTTVKTLSRTLLAEKLAEGWKLGDLYRVGAPEIGGWPW